MSDQLTTLQALDLSRRLVTEIDRRVALAKAGGNPFQDLIPNEELVAEQVEHFLVRPNDDPPEQEETQTMTDRTQRTYIGSDLTPEVIEEIEHRTLVARESIAKEVVGANLDKKNRASSEILVEQLAKLQLSPPSSTRAERKKIYDELCRLGYAPERQSDETLARLRMNNEEPSG